MRRALYIVLIVALLAGGVYASETRWSSILFGSPSATSAPADRAGLPGREVPMINSPHIPYLGAPHAAYNSVPPTSGPHLPYTASPGIYNEPVADELTVHALEHGHIAILYAANTPAAQVDTLKSLARKHPRDVVLAPHPGVQNGVALTAWSRIQNLDAVDEGTILTFINALSKRYVHGWQTRDQQVALSSAQISACGTCACGICC